MQPPMLDRLVWVFERLEAAGIPTAPSHDLPSGPSVVTFGYGRGLLTLLPVWTDRAVHGDARVREALLAALAENGVPVVWTGARGGAVVLPAFARHRSPTPTRPTDGQGAPVPMPASPPDWIGPIPPAIWDLFRAFSALEPLGIALQVHPSEDDFDPRLEQYLRNDPIRAGHEVVVQVAHTAFRSRDPGLLPLWIRGPREGVAQVRAVFEAHGVPVQAGRADGPLVVGREGQPEILQLLGW
ncbi:MAG: hypothetical protein R3F61_34355 [Myxococcota bacterium]